MLLTLLVPGLGQGSLWQLMGQSSSDSDPLKGKDQIFSYESYAAVLSGYVDKGGMVDYQGLKANRHKLDAFAASMKTLDPAVYESWNEQEKIALWINAYNAFTLQAIIDHYPIKASFFGSLRFPKNSIRQISGVWDNLQFQVMGRKLTLDDIEHRILRPEFNEPRLHMALVCAALGCPPLRNEPYLGEKLDSQLDEQSRRFLSNSEKFRINRSKRRVYLSKIFQWYGRDFEETHGTTQKFSEHDRSEGAVLNFLTDYLNAADREYVETGKYRIEYLNYDWSLNEQAR
ncbi:MAG: DUF547 domain-containing protein [Acidobacteriota bacterium]